MDGRFKNYYEAYQKYESKANAAASFCSDIPINNSVKNEDDKPFYSGSYKFSSKDFFDDDIGKIESNHSFIKILFLIIVIAICITGIYFLINFLGTR